MPNYPYHAQVLKSYKFQQNMLKGFFYLFSCITTNPIHIYSPNSELGSLPKLFAFSHISTGKGDLNPDLLFQFTNLFLHRCCNNQKRPCLTAVHLPEGVEVI